jgi:hypothetical protein
MTPGSKFSWSSDNLRANFLWFHNRLADNALSCSTALNVHRWRFKLFGRANFQRSAVYRGFKTRQVQMNFLADCSTPSLPVLIALLICGYFALTEGCWAQRMMLTSYIWQLACSRLRFHFQIFRYNDSLRGISMSDQCLILLFVHGIGACFFIVMW